MALVVYRIVARRGTLEFLHSLAVISIAYRNHEAISYRSIIFKATMKVCNGVQTQPSVLRMALARALCGASISRLRAIG